MVSENLRQATTKAAGAAFWTDCTACDQELSNSGGSIRTAITRQSPPRRRKELMSETCLRDHPNSAAKGSSAAHPPDSLPNTATTPQPFISATETAGLGPNTCVTENRIYQIGRA